MRKLFKISIICVMIIGFLTTASATVFASDTNNGNDDGIDERFGAPIVVYGYTLSDSERQEVRDLLNIKDPQSVKEYEVTGQDIANYINGNPTANLYSSAKIVMEEDGKGIKVDILTPQNITKVSTDMYANALLTAGVENAVVEVVSPHKVSGHSALTGIYKAFDAEGETLDKERMELANEELDVATDLAEKEGLSQEKVSELLTEIKKAIADQNPATKEDIEKIVKEQLDKLEISLSEADREMLNKLFDKMRDLNIDFDKVKSQLEDIASTIKDKIGDLGVELDAGFWEKVMNFFRDLFDSIANFFK